MMMPANFSAVAENEMTYVVGGGLVDCLAPVMTDENWQNVSANLIQIVGNGFLNNYGKKALELVFGGAYTPGDVVGKAWDILKNTFDSNNTGDWGFAKGALNAGLFVTAGLASVYALGAKRVGYKGPESIGIGFKASV